jgi:hypothetical protein
VSVVTVASMVSDPITCRRVAPARRASTSSRRRSAAASVPVLNAAITEIAIISVTITHCALALSWPCAVTSSRYCARVRATAVDV